MDERAGDAGWEKVEHPIYPKKIFGGKGFKIDLPWGSVTIYFENLEKWRRGDYSECKALYRPNSEAWNKRQDSKNVV
jgi:hypothetical protein